jgi:hypothetical protein
MQGRSSFDIGSAYEVGRTEEWACRSGIDRHETTKRSARIFFTGTIDHASLRLRSYPMVREGTRVIAVLRK